MFTAQWKKKLKNKNWESGGDESGSGHIHGSSDGK